MPVKKTKKRASKKAQNCTIMISNDDRLEMKKYKRLKDIPGDHFDVDITSLISTPNGYSKDEWIIVNLIDFLQRIELLYSSCSLFCTSDTCPLLNAGPKYCYFWEDDDSPQPIQVSAPEYFDALKRYIKRNLLNKELFPDEIKAPLSPKADEIIKTSYRRLFRILAHLYICHYSDISKLTDLKYFEIMNTILAHYTNFVLLYQVCKLEDFAIFAPVFEAINKETNSNSHFHCPKFSNIE